MNKIKILIRKEIMDILRDRKTLIMMVAVPILLYPLIVVGTALIFGRIAQSQEEKVYTVGCPAGYEETVGRLEALYQEGREKSEEEGGLVFAVYADGSEPLKAEPDVRLDITEQDGAEHMIIRYNSTETDSESAMYEMEELLEQYRKELLEERLAEQGLTEDFLYPVTFESKDQASDSESFGMDIGGSIGMMLVVTILRFTRRSTRRPGKRSAVRLRRFSRSRSQISR